MGELTPYDSVKVAIRLISKKPTMCPEKTNKE
jgi:hypothetical protein